MTVYVDRPVHQLGRMLMCHMVADSNLELVAMAVALGLDPKHIQKPGAAEEHFDVCKAKRARALLLGAVEITPQELVGVIRKKRESVPGAAVATPRKERNSKPQKVEGA